MRVLSHRTHIRASKRLPEEVHNVALARCGHAWRHSRASARNAMVQSAICVMCASVFFVVPVAILAQAAQSCCVCGGPGRRGIVERGASGYSCLSWALASAHAQRSCVVLPCAAFLWRASQPHPLWRSVSAHGEHIDSLGRWWRCGSWCRRPS